MIYALYILILISAPLAFGTVEIWSITFMEVGIILCTCFFLIDYLVRKKSILYHPPGFSFYLLFLAVFLLQIIPLPAIIVQYISPNLFSLTSRTVGLFHEIQNVSLSINKKETLNEFFRLASYGCMYFLTVQLLSKSKYLHRTVNIVVILGSIIAFQALLQKVTSDRLIYWFRPVPENAIQPMGPYIYHNHFAGLMEMLFPLAFILFLANKPHFSFKSSIKKKVVEFFNNPRMKTFILSGVGSMLIASSIFVSLSRGGVLSLICAFNVLIFLLFLRGKLGRNKAITFFIPALTFMLIGWFGWDSIIERFFHIYTPEKGIDNERLLVWNNSFQIIKDYLLTGTGFGSFKDVFPGYRSFVGGATYYHAHNDFIELLITGGVTGFLALGLFFIFLLFQSFQTFLKRKDNFAVLLFCGCLTAIFALLIHSVTDFNFYNGANGLYFFFICGLLVSAAYTKNNHLEKQKSLLSTNIGSIRPLFLLIALIMIIPSIIKVNKGILQAQIYSDEIQIGDFSTIPKDRLIDIQKTLNQMMLWDPWEAKYQFLAGNVALYTGKTSQAFDYYMKAVQLNPTESAYVRRLGIIADLLGKNGVDELLDEGIRLAPMDSSAYMESAKWHIYKGNLDKAIIAMRTGLHIEPHKLKEYIRLMEDAGFVGKDMIAAIPHEIYIQYKFGRYLQSNKWQEEANMTLDLISELLLDKNYIPNLQDFINVSEFYTDQQEEGKALALLTHGIKYFPAEADIYFRIGNIHINKGDIDGAKEAYQKALSLSPEKIEVYLAIGKISSASGDNEKADKMFKQALSLLENNSILGIRKYLSAIDFFEKNNELERALRVAEKGFEFFPKSVRMAYELADLYNTMGKRIRAQDACDNAWELLQNETTEYAWLYRSIARLYLKQNMDEKSLQVLKLAVQVYPSDIKTLEELAYSYMKLNMDQQAKEILQHIIMLSPDNEKAKSELEKIESIQ